MLVGVFHVMSFGFCLQDDTYIGLRYSRNLADGHGLVFNPGEHVEGYTNFSWIILSTVPYLFNLDAIVYARVISIISAALAIMLVGIMSNILSKGLRGAAFTASILFANLPFVMGEAAMGLETLFFVALVLAALSRYVLEHENSEERGYGSGLFLAFGALTRPEAIGIALILVVFDLLKLRKSTDDLMLKKQVKARWICFAIPVLSHMAFRWFYYGDYVPNTFHAKVGGGINALSRGMYALKQLIMDIIPLIIALSIGMVASRKARKLRDSFAVFVLSAVMLFYTVYVMYIGGDFRPTNRYYILPVALLVVITGSILPLLLQSVKNKKYYVAYVPLLLVLSFSCHYSFRNIRNYSLRRRHLIPIHIAAAEWLSSEFPADTWIATGNVGVIPYQSQLCTIDMHGLCDRHIAERSIPGMGEGIPGHEKGDGLYILSRHPEIILFMYSRFSDHPLSTSEIEADLFGISEVELWLNPYFHDNYTLVSIFLERFYFNFYTKNDWQILPD